jgi:hypothetical protein
MIRLPADSERAWAGNVFRELVERLPGDSTRRIVASKLIESALDVSRVAEWCYIKPNPIPPLIATSDCSWSIAGLKYHYLHTVDDAALQTCGELAATLTGLYFIVPSRHEMLLESALNGTIKNCRRPGVFSFDGFFNWREMAVMMYDKWSQSRYFLALLRTYNSKVRDNPELIIDVSCVSETLA